jgi:leucyl aminopeptidase (aminopeptidase T)
MADDFDVETLADKTLETLAPAAGQVIWIWASTHSLDLIEALAFRIRARGGFWTLRLTMESLLRRIAQEVAEPYLGLIPEHELRWLDDIDAIIAVRDHGGHVSGAALPRRRAMGTEWITLIDAAARKGCRRLNVFNPTQALAAAIGIEPGKLRAACWAAIDVDHHALDQRQARVRQRLATAEAVHVTSELGTDLQLRIDRRPVHMDLDSVPRGEVYVAPHEDAADGVAVIDRAFLRGKPVERLALTFVKGRVVAASAPDASAVAAFWDLLAASSGEKDVIGEFAIALNPGATELVGDVMLDEKIGGSVHIAIGMNEALGGRNRSNLHLDLVMLHPTVWLDGAPVVVDAVVEV